jgi:hypothetical protein
MEIEKKNLWKNSLNGSKRQSKNKRGTDGIGFNIEGGHSSIKLCNSKITSDKFYKRPPENFRNFSTLDCDMEMLY